MFIKHPAAWVTGSIDARLQSYTQAFSIMLISVESTYNIILVGSLFVCSIHRHLLEVTSQGIIVESILYTQVAITWRLSVITIMAPVTYFFDILQLQCLHRVLGADVFHPGEYHWLKILHQCVKTGFPFHVHTSKYP